MNSNVVTTVDTMTAPLSEVYFPSAVVCNINQVYRKTSNRGRTQKMLSKIEQCAVLCSVLGKIFFGCGLYLRFYGPIYYLYFGLPKMF